MTSDVQEEFPDLVVSIGTLGRVALLEQCLDTVFAEDDRSFSIRVWVVYNGSEDPAVASRIRTRYPTVQLSMVHGPLGYCRTHNVVLMQTRARYVLLLDDDTLVPKGTLPAMIRFMDANPRVGLAGCKTLNRDGSYQPSFGLVPTLRAELRNVVQADAFWTPALYRSPDSIQDVEWLNGSFMLVRNTALAQVGPLDEHYYTYVCEADWAERFRRAGWRVTYVGEVSIVHEGGEHSINNKLTVTNAANLVRYHVNRYYFFRKHHGAWSVVPLRLMMIAGSLLRMLRYIPWLASDDGRRAVARAKIYAFWRVMVLSLGATPWQLPADLQSAAS